MIFYQFKNTKSILFVGCGVASCPDSDNDKKTGAHVLKMDSEGCEYGTILNTLDKTLQDFPLSSRAESKVQDL